MNDGQDIDIRLRGDGVDHDLGKLGDRELPRAVNTALAAQKRECLKHLHGLPDARNHAVGSRFVIIGDGTANMVEIGNGLGRELTFKAQAFPTLVRR